MDKELNICSNTLKEFNGCNCSQCQAFLDRQMDGTMIPSEMKKYLITEKERQDIIKSQETK